MKIRNFTVKEFGEFCVSFTRGPKRMRMGQALCNAFLEEGSWPELFYEEDDVKAFHMFLVACAEQGVEAVNGSAADVYGK